MLHAGAAEEVVLSCGRTDSMRAPSGKTAIFGANSNPPPQASLQMMLLIIGSVETKYNLK